MAGEAARKLVVECLLVRQTVTVGTLRHIAVFVLVTGHTGERAVFAGVLSQSVEYLGMTGTTGARRHILAEGDLQGLMNRMTRETG